VAVVLGVNAVFHDPAAALVVDGKIVAAAEEERFSRRKHGKEAVPFSTWEVPAQSAKWCLEHAGIRPEDLDAVGYSYDPALAPPVGRDITADKWEPLRSLFAWRAPFFLESALEGLDPACVRFVPHHVAHAASAYLASPFEKCSVMVLDGRGEASSYLAGQSTGGNLQVLATQPLPDSLGLMYEELTAHLGFRRGSDEYKVMALASYGSPAFLPEMRRRITVTDAGGFHVEPIDWGALAKARKKDQEWTQDHADLASSVQKRLEEILVELAFWLYEQTGDTKLAMAGGVALNCVANSQLARKGPFDDIWVQPAAGDAGTALGAALYLARHLGDAVEPMTTAALGRPWSEEKLRGALQDAALVYDRPADLAATVAEALANDDVVGWFHGRSEYGPRALGHRSLLANPSRAENLDRMNRIKGREEFRPVAPMVLADRAAEIFDGPLPSPFMLFTHRVRKEWRDRIPAVVHVDGTSRVQTVDPAQEPLVGALLREFEARTGLPVLVNTSFNTAGRPMVDHPVEALECFGSGPIDLLCLGPFVVRRHSLSR
jgi:carbamoyltransferase